MPPKGHHEQGGSDHPGGICQVVSQQDGPVCKPRARASVSSGPRPGKFPVNVTEVIRACSTLCSATSIESVVLSLLESDGEYD